MELDELIERVGALKSPEAQAYAHRLEKSWALGVCPSPREIKRLSSFLNVPGPCGRLDIEGRCERWLQKYGPENGVKAEEPFLCPFGSGEKWGACPGYTPERT